MKSTVVSLKYVSATSAAFSTPNAGKSTSGRREVATMGQASVTQYTAMMRMTYAASAACVNGKGHSVTYAEGKEHMMCTC